MATAVDLAATLVKPEAEQAAGATQADPKTAEGLELVHPRQRAKETAAAKGLNRTTPSASFTPAASTTSASSRRSSSFNR
jgi:hypothetical protein